MIDARAVFRGELEIAWESVRKVAVDDGTRWGYVSAVCRFPVYDVRPDGSGSGVLIGPLWSTGSSLMPPACPVAALDPVPDQAPNVALIIEPRVSGPALRDQNGAGPRAADSIAVLLLRADDPTAAHEALAARITVGDVDHGDLVYLSGAASNGASASVAASNGASASSSS